MRIYSIFDLININDKYRPWDWDQIGIKLETELTIYEKLASFMYKMIYMLAGLKVSSLACKCIFYRTRQNAMWGLKFEGLEMKIKYSS